MDENKKYTILIVEDEEMLLDVYVEALQMAGFEVLAAPDAYKAEKLLQEKIGVIDLVVLDIMLPGKDGLALLREVKENPEKFGTPKFVMLTNMTSNTIITEAFNHDADSYLIKTEMEYDDLVKEVKKVLAE